MAFSGGRDELIWGVMLSAQCLHTREDNRWVPPEPPDGSCPRALPGCSSFLKSSPAKYESAVTGGSAEGAAQKPAGKLTVRSWSKLDWIMFCIKHGAVSVPWEQTRSRAFPDSGSSTRIPRAPPYAAVCSATAQVLFAFDYCLQMSRCECAQAAQRAVQPARVL